MIENRLLPEQVQSRIQTFLDYIGALGNKVDALHAVLVLRLSSLDKLIVLDRILQRGGFAALEQSAAGGEYTTRSFYPSRRADGYDPRDYSMGHPQSAEFPT